jgi:hypothetical protein
MLGHAGDSFNDVISKLLRIERSYKEMKKQQEEQQYPQENGDDSSGLPFIPIPSAAFEEQNKQQIDDLVQLLQGERRGRCSMNNQTIREGRIDKEKIFLKCQPCQPCQP